MKLSDNFKKIDKHQLIANSWRCEICNLPMSIKLLFTLNSWLEMEMFKRGILSFNMEKKKNSRAKQTFFMNNYMQSKEFFQPQVLHKTQIWRPFLF